MESSVTSKHERLPSRNFKNKQRIVNMHHLVLRDQFKGGTCIHFRSSIQLSLCLERDKAESEANPNSDHRIILSKIFMFTNWDCKGT